MKVRFAVAPGGLAFDGQRFPSMTVMGRVEIKVQ